MAKVIVRSNDNLFDEHGKVNRNANTEFVTTEENAKKLGKKVTVLRPFGEPVKRNTPLPEVKEEEKPNGKKAVK